MGALCLVVAADLERYRPLVRFLGAGFALAGLVLLGVDVGAGMPWWWSAFEGPLWAGVGALMFFLARPAPKLCTQGETPCQPPAPSSS